MKDLLVEALCKGHIGIKQVCSSLIKCATVSLNRQNVNCIATTQSLTKVYLNFKHLKEYIFSLIVVFIIFSYWI